MSNETYTHKLEQSNNKLALLLAACHRVMKQDKTTIISLQKRLKSYE